MKGMGLLSVLPLAIGCHNEAAAEAQITGVFMHVQPELGQGGFRTLPTVSSSCSPNGQKYLRCHGLIFL